MNKPTVSDQRLIDRPGYFSFGTKGVMMDAKTNKESGEPAASGRSSSEPVVFAQRSQRRLTELAMAEARSGGLCSFQTVEDLLADFHANGSAHASLP